MDAKQGPTPQPTPTPVPVTNEQLKQVAGGPVIWNYVSSICDEDLARVAGGPLIANL